MGLAEPSISGSEGKRGIEEIVRSNGESFLPLRSDLFGELLHAHTIQLWKTCHFDGEGINKGLKNCGLLLLYRLDGGLLASTKLGLRKIGGVTALAYI